MAYKKYIKKGGKIYGPYIYHSRRVGGKVISEYHGPKKPDYKKFFLIALGVLVLISLAYILSLSEKGITGRAVLDLDANYQEGQPLEGKIRIALQEGEFIPSSSKLIFENEGNVFEYTLKDLVPGELSQGDFYVIGTSISGTGEGYGVAGEKEIFPFLNFILIVESETTEENEVVSILNEVSGQVSAEKPFTYILKKGETKAELKPLSVNFNGERLSDNEVELIIEGNDVSVTTDYSEIEEGFGKDYLGDKEKEVSIDISSLGLIFEDGSLKISLVSSGEEILSLITYIGEEVILEEVVLEEPVEEVAPPEEQEPEITLETTNELTEAERAVLEAEFGAFSVEVSEAKSKKGFIIIRYELRDYWVEHSYDGDLDPATLESYMQEDRIKWLKDIASKLSEKEEPEQELEELEGNYSV